ncbi:DnaJ like subfamily C GRV2 [Dendrobium catenatum]|uniref:DnaJ like subfamily C GRV2 n=1 Tax=Dendrobium catenatum TaxID=906689 RepID=A0A2I0WPZ5_9ASPA|nr:DnaJ like subfamily C GRV2 [Dendrobium catenatum]
MQRESSWDHGRSVHELEPPGPLLFLPLLLLQGGGMDLSRVGEKIFSSVRSARSLGLLSSTSDRPEVLERVAAAAAAARALAGLPPHERIALTSNYEDITFLYGSKGQTLEVLEEEFYEEVLLVSETLLELSLFIDVCPIHVYASTSRDSLLAAIRAVIQAEGQYPVPLLSRLIMPGHRIDPPCGRVYLQMQLHNVMGLSIGIGPKGGLGQQGDSVSRQLVLTRVAARREKQKSCKKLFLENSGCNPVVELSETATIIGGKLL